MKKFKEILRALDLSNEDFDDAFNEIKEKAMKSEGPIETIENWNNGRTKGEARVFVQGIAMMFLMDQFTEKAIRNKMFV